MLNAVERIDRMDRRRDRQGELYEQTLSLYGGSLARLLRGYESDRHRRQDLAQDVHFQLWRSFAVFDERCSLRTWVFRVAHNTAATHVQRQMRDAHALVNIEDADIPAAGSEPEAALDRERRLESLALLIRTLKPLDRQVILCYLEGLEAGEIGEITGLSPAAVAMKVHRIKKVLGVQLQEATRHRG